DGVTTRSTTSGAEKLFELSIWMRYAVAAATSVQSKATGCAGVASCAGLRSVGADGVGGGAAPVEFSKTAKLGKGRRASDRAQRKVVFRAPATFSLLTGTFRGRDRARMGAKPTQTSCRPSFAAVANPVAPSEPQRRRQREGADGPAIVPKGRSFSALLRPFRCSQALFEGPIGRRWTRNPRKPRAARASQPSQTRWPPRSPRGADRERGQTGQRSCPKEGRFPRSCDLFAANRHFSRAR